MTFSWMAAAAGVLAFMGIVAIMWRVQYSLSKTGMFISDVTGVHHTWFFGAGILLAIAAVVAYHTTGWKIAVGVGVIAVVVTTMGDQRRVVLE